MPKARWKAVFRYTRGPVGTRNQDSLEWAHPVAVAKHDTGGTMRGLSGNSHAESMALIAKHDTSAEWTEWEFTHREHGADRVDRGQVGGGPPAARGDLRL